MIYTSKNNLGKFAGEFMSVLKGIFATRGQVGAPLTANYVANMTNHDKVYVYTGNESGYTSGNWYFWDGVSWTSGGVYNSVAVQTDTTLAMSGVAADSEAVGNKFLDIKSRIEEAEEIISVPTSVRRAMLALFESSAYATTGLTDEIDLVKSWAAEVTEITLSDDELSLSGSTPQTLTATTVPSGKTVVWSSSDNTIATVEDGVVTGVYNGTCIITATAGNLSATCTVTVSGFATVESISAVYTQGGTVYNTDSLDSLKSDLVVTATYSDTSVKTVPSDNYVLSGTLSVGTSTITVSYFGETSTFTVTVTDSGYLYYWDFTDSVVDRVNGTIATLYNVERTSNGVTMSADTRTGEDPYSEGYHQAIRLGNVFGRGKEIEIDLKNVSNVNTVTRALISLHGGDNSVTPGNSYNVFGYHYSTTESNDRYGIVTSDQAHWGYPSSSNVGAKTYLNGNCTIKMEVDSSGNIKVYRDDVDMNIKYSNAYQTISAQNCSHVNVGCLTEHEYGENYSGYAPLINATITGVRIKNIGA